MPSSLARHNGRVRLEPLTLDHAAPLFAAIDDPEVWRLRPDRRPANVDEMKSFLTKRLAELPPNGIATTAGSRWPMIIRITETDEVAGTTGYLELDPANRSLEIGATVVAPKWQRTFVNTECKLLLLTHAFEVFHAVRVYFKVDTRNERSQRAVQRLGATREGTLRKSRICWDGYIRDTAVFSIIAEEWGAVKTRLQQLSAR